MPGWWRRMLGGTPADSAAPPPAVPVPETRPVVPATVPRPEADDAPQPLADRPRADGEVPPIWRTGDLILDTYEVLDVHDGGGMGLVYRVHHRDWGIELAVKCPRPELFTTDALREGFVGECLAWVHLGLHPNIACCYFVRVLGGVPRVFAEYVGGGTLQEWIDDRRLYADGADESLARILDVAIQIGHGLDHAHSAGEGLVHQDVKPANVLMTSDGVAKVTDFGLARARPGLAAGAREREGSTVLVTAGGMTPAFCSPEQSAGRPVSRRTDVWSWALVVLEMFAGEVFWQSGAAAPQALALLLEGGAPESPAPPMPAAVAGLLGECFAIEPGERPSGMAAVVERLAAIHAEVIGRPHGRERPHAVDALADALNNQAVSLLDLGRPEHARATLNDALRVDPQHVEATYNRALLDWRNGTGTDGELRGALASLETGANRERVAALVARVEAEAGLGTGAGEPDPVRVRLTLPPERGNINARCLAGDRQSLYLGMADGRVHRYDVRGDGEHAAARLIHTFDGHSGPVSALAVDNAGSLLAIASEDRTVSVWSIADAELVQLLSARDTKVNGVALARDGLVTAGDDGVVRLWDIGSGEVAAELAGGEDEIFALAVGPDRRTLATGGRDCKVRVWRPGDANVAQVHEVHLRPIVGLAFTDDATLASIGLDGELAVIDTAAGTVSRTVSLPARPYGRGAECIAADPGGGHLLLALWGDVLALWDTRTWACACTLQGSALPAALAAPTPESPELVAVCWNELSVRRWTGRGPAAPWALSAPVGVVQHASSLRLLGEALRACDEEPEDTASIAAIAGAREHDALSRHPALLDRWRRLGERCRKNELRGVWPVHELRGHGQTEVGAIAVVESARAVIAGDFEGVVRVWDMDTAEPRVTLHHHSDRSVVALVGAEGRDTFLSCGDGGRVLLESVAGGDGRLLLAADDPIGAVAVNGDWSRCAIGTRGGHVHLLDLATGECVKVLPPHGGEVVGLALSPAGDVLLSTVRVNEEFDHECRLWVAPFDRPQPIGEDDSVGELVAVTPTGTEALVTVRGRGATLRDPELTSISLADGAARAVMALADSGDDVCRMHPFLAGRYTAFGCDFGTIGVWDNVARRSVFTTATAGAQTCAVAVSEPGNYLATGGYDRTVRLHALDWELAVPPSRWDPAAEHVLRQYLALLAPFADDRVSRLAPVAAAIAEHDFVADLRRHGLGWVDPDRVRATVEALQQRWDEVARPAGAFGVPGVAGGGPR